MAHEYFDPFSVDWSKISNKWISCIDLLGFSRYVQEHGWPSIFSVYSQCLDHLAWGARRSSTIEHAWFSDTFLLYSSNDSAADFAALEQQTRWFISVLIQKQIPLRGAMACGRFFADRNNSVYLGEALVDAYRFSERQDWIGFVLTPSAIERLVQVDLPADERLNYQYWDIPWKPADWPVPPRLPALRVGWNALLAGRNLQVEALEEMARLQRNPVVRAKYSRTLQFLSRQ